MVSVGIVSIYLAKHSQPIGQGECCRWCTFKEQVQKRQSKEPDYFQHANNPHNEDGDEKFLLFTVISTRVHEAELKTIKDARKTDLLLNKFLEIPRSGLKRKEMKVCLQGVLYKVENDKHLKMAPHSLRQNILVEKMMCHHSQCVDQSNWGSH